jgi:hypothetical protein
LLCYSFSNLHFNIRAIRKFLGLRRIYFMCLPFTGIAPAGLPFFAMLGKVFSLLSLGDNTKVPYFTNMGSAIASGATIMFLFWTITAMAKKLLLAKREKEVWRCANHLIMGAGLVGALAFTYTDTFWFSAVETIVFALSSTLYCYCILGHIKMGCPCR